MDIQESLNRLQDPKPEREKIALFDLDGTLADYTGSMQAYLEAMRSPGDPPVGDDWFGDIPAWLANRVKLIKTQPNWWSDLPLLKDGKFLWDHAQKIGFETHILSKGPWKNSMAWKEKVDWCHKHLENMVINLTEDKGIHYGTLLVDDYPDYITRWLQWRPRGVVIMPDRNINRGFEHPQVFRYKYTEDGKKAAAEILQRAFDR
jgi:5'-nucleotidase